MIKILQYAQVVSYIFYQIFTIGKQLLLFGIEKPQ